MTPLCKLIWLRENSKSLFDAAYKFISIKEYIWYYLFDEFEVDHSIASATGLFDIKELRWYSPACELAGISPDRLSKPVNTGYKRSELSPAAKSTLKLADVPFVIGASDGCCANLGSYVMEPGVASLTIGTSGAVRITSQQPVVNDEAMIFNYLLNEHTFVCGGAINNGGITLDWLLKNFLGEKRPGHDEYQQLFRQIAAIPAGSDGLLFLPYLYGERAPLWDTKTCGTFFNIKPAHTTAHFLRAGLEGICFALNNVLHTLEQSSTPIKKLHISGGFITSEVWVQMLTDITGKELVIAQEGDASAIGAIMLALKSLGLDEYPEPDEAQQKTTHPNADNHKIYEESFYFFKKLYFDLKDTMHQMHNRKKK
jgi:gluconokinase